MEDDTQGQGTDALLQKIVDLLVAGGYPRSAMSSFSPFDKLIDGLAWCITASNADIDFDLSCDDDATLGCKIKMGEAIEAALRAMECPHSLQAHQIQGLDYQAVYPVVQWLVQHLKLTWDTRVNQEEKKQSLLLEMEKLNKKIEEAGVGLLVQKVLPLSENCKTLQEEVSFQACCREKHKDLLACSVKLETETAHTDRDSCGVEVSETLDQDLIKLKVLKGDLGKATQRYLTLHRKIDDVPCQAELMQYERRFVELYLHIQEKLRETRNYYAMHNALGEANELTLKEISLLNSIQTQFEVAMTSTEGRSKFVTSLNDISKGVLQKLQNLETRLQDESNALLALKEQHAKAVAARRHYANLMKLFQEECGNNAKLQALLDHTSSTSA